ncbi:MAG: histidinol dehydrogenase, partial [Bacillus sp. (in: Bacteria)]|nr:histidinol dehydrogenase [Bacillus sp. (in: firmicutes)]
MIRELTREEFTKTFLSSNNKSNALNPEILTTAKKVLDEIQLNGDEALRKYVLKFDGKVPEQWEVSEEERKHAWNEVSEDVITALQKAAENIRNFHRKQLQNSRMMDMSEDIISGQLFRPLERVGIYVPGGTACYKGRNN